MAAKKTVKKGVARKPLGQRAPTEAELAQIVHKPHVMSEKTRLLGLYEQLQNLNVRSISDLEVLISRAD